MGLLGRAYAESGVRLLFWCLLCFAGLAVDNVVLCIDKVVAPDVDLSVWRGLPAVYAVRLLASVPIAAAVIERTGGRPSPDGQRVQLARTCGLASLSFWTVHFIVRIVSG